MEHLGTFIIQHWALFLALLIVLVLILINEIMSHKQHAHEITPQAAIQKINHEEATLFDIRSREEFDKGHIIDSLHTTAVALQQKKMDKYKQKSVILICTNGINSTKLATQLQATGFKQVFSLQGGIDAWRKADLPLVKK